MFRLPVFRSPVFAPFCALVLLWVSACAQKLPGDDPDDGVVLYYPSSIAVAADGNFAYVVNSNFDQQFNTGWVTSINMAQLIGDPNNPRAALTRGAFIPNLGGRISLSADGAHAFVPHRGSGVLTVLDIAEGKVTCGPANEPDQTGLTSNLKRSSCDNQHFVDLVAQAQYTTQNLQFYTQFNYRDFQDPYSVAVLPGNPTLQGLGIKTPVVVGYLSSGWMSVLDATPGAAPTVKGNLYFGNTNLVNLLPHGTDRVMASSRKSGTSLDKSVVYDTDVGASLTAKGVGAQLAQFIRGDVGTNLAGIDIVDVAFSPDQQRLYASNRSPDSVAVLRLTPFGSVTTVSQPGAPPALMPYALWQVVGSATIDDSDPTDLVYIPRAVGSDLVAMGSLLDDAIYFLAPRGDQLQVVQRLQMISGQGPFGMRHVNYQGSDYLLVSTFFDHGITLVDISSPSYADFRILTEVHEDDLGIAPRGR